MSEIFSQLAHLFLQTVPTVVIVFLLFIGLDRIFFRPVMAVMQEREDRTAGALARARERAGAAEAKAREYEEAFQAARQEVYRQREAQRHAVLEECDATLHKARERAEALARGSQAELAQEVARAQGELEAACRPLAEEISERLVGQAITTGPEGARL